MIVATEAVIAHSHRYADLAEKTPRPRPIQGQGRTAGDRRDLPPRARIPARNFAKPSSPSGSSIWPSKWNRWPAPAPRGRYGQYMYPFYKKDIEEGNLTANRS